MKKRTKLIVSLIALSVLVISGIFGVYSVLTPSFAVTSNIVFDTTNVFAKITGQVQRGETIATLADLSEPEGSTTQNYSYEATNFTDANLDGSPVGSEPSNDSLEAWQIGDIKLLEDETIARISISVKNYSSFYIKLEVSNAPASTESITVTTDATSVQSIAPGATGTYTITFTLVNVATSSNLTFESFGITLSETEAPAA